MKRWSSIFAIAFLFVFGFFLWKNQVQEEIPVVPEQEIRVGADSIAIINKATQQATPFAFTAHSGATDPAIAIIALCNGSNLTTAASYAGVALTKVGAIVSSSVDSGTELSLWVLANPASGSNNATITCAGSSPRMSILSFSGVDQTTPFNASNFATEEDTSASANDLAITTAYNNSWLIGGLISPTQCQSVTWDSNTAASCGAGSTANYIGIYSPTAQTPAGSYALGFTTSMTSVMIVAELIASGETAGGAVVPVKIPDIIIFE